MKYVVLALATVIALGSGGYVYWTSTPEFALYQIKESVQQKNKAQFEGYVDVKRITGSVVDEFAQLTLSKATKNKNGWAALGGMFAAKMIETMKPQVESMVEKELSKIFEAERSVASNKKDKNQFKEFTDVRGQLTFLDYEKKDCSSQICYFDISFQHDIVKNQVTLKAKLEKVNGTWKLVELPSLIEQLKKLKA